MFSLQIGIIEKWSITLPAQVNMQWFHFLAGSRTTKIKSYTVPEVASRTMFLFLHVTDVRYSAFIPVNNSGIVRIIYD